MEPQIVGKPMAQRVPKRLSSESLFSFFLPTYIVPDFDKKINIFIKKYQKKKKKRIYFYNNKQYHDIKNTDSDKQNPYFFIFGREKHPTSYIIP